MKALFLSCFACSITYSETVNHVWRIFFTYELSCVRSIIISRILVFSFPQSRVPLCKGYLHEQPYSEKRFQSPWRLNGVDVLKRDDAPSRRPKERTLDLCRLNETTSVALSFANDINAFSDSAFDLAFPDICEELFPQAKQCG